MDVQKFREQILSVSNDKGALQIRGGGTKDWYGQSPHGALLDTRAHHGIIDYDPTELVITARCGTPLAELEAVLAERHQLLAFEPPHFGAGATVGGMVASGLSGPSRQAMGGVRDYVLGAVLMDGKGDILRFGGQVMKNVAGYDVSRLLAGSLGTLGLILEVSLKVLPRPIAVSSRRFAVAETEAIRWLNQWSGQPLPISASCWCDGVLTVRLSGAQAAVGAAEKKIGGEMVADADAFWHGVREQTNAFFNSASSLWRLSVPSVTPPPGLPGTTLIEWGGAQRWLVGDVDPTEIRAAVSAIGGHATLYRCSEKNIAVFRPLTPAITKIHQRLKNVFDPAGIFNPGRMFPDVNQGI